MKDNRDQRVPKELNLFRGDLGDAGIPHLLLLTKGGWPYVRFERPSDGKSVSLQYRREKRNRETGETKPARFLLFVPNSETEEQDALHFASAEDLRSHLNLSDEMLAAGRESRGAMSDADRALSVPMDPEKWLDRFRMALGDVGVPHRYFTPVGKRHYVVFDRPEDGATVYMQYRANAAASHGAVGPHLAAIVRVKGAEETRMTFPDVTSALAAVGVGQDALRDGAERRGDLPLDERAKSVLAPAVEASYVAMMR